MHCSVELNLDLSIPTQDTQEFFQLLGIHRWIYGKFSGPFLGTFVQNVLNDSNARSAGTSRI